MNTKLTEQINKFFGSLEKLPQDAKTWNEFLQTINETYESYEKNQTAQINTALLGQKVIEIETERARDDAIIESIGEGIIVTDAKGRVLMTNRIVEEMLGTVADELKNKVAFEGCELFDRDGNLLISENIPTNRTLKTGKKNDGTFDMRRKNGMTSTIEINSNPVIQSGQTVGVVAILRDVTEQKAIDRMKTEFISLASHQLRTPLSAIKWFAEMLLAGDAGKLNQEQQDFTQNIYDSIERMMQLINSLLNIARVESGKVMIEPSPTDIKTMVEEVAKEFEETIARKQLRFTINVSGDLPKITLDPRLIRPVYFNLLSNAIKYTPNGGQVSVAISQKEGNMISQIIDTGYGIPKNQQVHIFQKFFRADNAAKKETVGTGLGLYLTKAIVEASKGKIWFLSEENKGTIFWFVLPLSGIPAQQGDVSLD